MFVVVRQSADAEPLFATSDPRVVAAVLRSLIEIAGGADRTRLLHLVRRVEREVPQAPVPEGA